MTDQRAEILLVEDNPNDVKLTMNAFKTANAPIFRQIKQIGNIRSNRILVGLHHHCVRV